MLPIGQQLWLKDLESYVAYPPLQAAVSYNLSQVIEQVKKAHLSQPSDYSLEPLRHGGLLARRASSNSASTKGDRKYTRA